MVWPKYIDKFELRKKIIDWNISVMDKTLTTTQSKRRKFFKEFSKKNPEKFKIILTEFMRQIHTFDPSDSKITNLLDEDVTEEYN